MPIHHLSSGLRVRTFPPPPQEFDPIKADDELLIRYGLPPRPTEESLQHLWELAFRDPIHYIEPSFTEVPDIQHGPLQITALTSHGWSGTVVFRTSGVMNYVHGRWTVPDAQPPAPLGDYYSSHWVGIDGWGTPLIGSSDVLQTCTECSAVRTSNSIDRITISGGNGSRTPSTRSITFLSHRATRSPP